MTETTTAHLERAAKARQTRQSKTAEHEAGDFPSRAWVKVKDGRGHYSGRVGKVQSHNDIRSKQHPTITVEIGVVFSKGGQPTWFEPGELDRCPPPAQHW